MNIFRAVDLETNGVDVRTCEVAQVAIVSARSEQGVPVLQDVKTSKTLCRVQSMPAGATKVHGLTVEGLTNEPPFMAKVRGLLGALTKPGVVIVTFNGVGFDLPVIARYAAAHGKLQEFIAGDYTTLPGHDDLFPSVAAQPVSARERFDELLNRRHIDVARVWQVVRAKELQPPWTDEGASRYMDYAPVLHAGMFAGSLAAAHGFWLGRGFDGAHEAGVDCGATLAVLRAMLTSGFMDVETAMRWSREPLPGDVDFDGAFRWDGDQAICTLKRFKDVPIEDVDREFLAWMLDAQRDFHRHTKHVVREWLAGHYPVREYEKEDPAWY